MNDNLNTFANNGDCMCFEADADITLTDKIKAYTIIGGFTALAAYGAAKLGYDLGEFVGEVWRLRKAQAVDLENAKAAQAANTEETTTEN
jgi:hypothetical protein